VSPRAWASAFTTLASLGVRRQAQLIRTIDGAPESESRRSPLQVLSAEVAWLTASMLPSGKLAVRDPGGDWLVAWSADFVLVVVADEPRAAALGGEILRLLPSHPLVRPATLIAKNGELFAPGSLPREEPALPPE
jgi:hypothetical protein